MLKRRNNNKKRQILFSNAPAENFLQAFPLGNGTLGAMVYGGKEKEILKLNEITLWSGKKHDCINPKAREALPEIRDLFFQGKYPEADQLAREALCRITPDGSMAEEAFGAYLPLGDLEIFFDRTRVLYSENYRRELDLQRGIITVSDNIASRHYFISYPDQVLCIRMSSADPEPLHVFLRLRREKETELPTISADEIMLCGKVSGGRKFAVKCRIVLSGSGTLIPHPDSLELREAASFMLILSAATDFSGGDPASAVSKTLQKASLKQWDQLKRAHSDDFSGMMKRCMLSVGETPRKAGDLNQIRKWLTDRRYTGYAASLFFQYGRYLLASSSRGMLPATIQCLWNAEYRPPWNCDYHLNANTQMIYWPAEKTNLSECAMPLFRWMKTLAAEGRKTAKKTFGAKGWCAAWISNPAGYAAVGHDLQWGLFPEAGGWLCRHIWEHYQYTLDEKFLREYYPLMHGAAEFCLDMLAENPEDGKLLFGPTVPPEHGFITENGKHCFLVWGSSAGQEIVYDLFRNTVNAAKILAKDSAFSQKLEAALSRLALPGSDREGMLAKWCVPLKSDGCRHLRHTYGHFPGERISPKKTPSLIPALRKAIQDHEKDSRKSYWGNGSWSGVWLMHHYAKLGNAAKAYQSLLLLMQKTTAPNLFTLNGGIFQADGILGSISGISEMLLQSHDGLIHVLPALPPSWHDGRVEGMKTKGAFTLDVQWHSSSLTVVKIFAGHDGICRIQYKNAYAEFTMKRGEKLLLDGHLKKCRGNDPLF